MGQGQSTPHSATRAAPPSPATERRLAELHSAQLHELGSKLARLVDALTLVDATAATATGSGAGVLVDVAPTESAATTAALLRPFAEVHLAGYQLGDAVLLQPVTVAPEQPPCTPLSLLRRNTALTLLDLSYNGLTADIVQPLLAAVGQLPVLTVLRLSGNPLGSAVSLNSDILEIAEALHLGSGVRASEAEASDPSHACVAAAQLGDWLATGPALQELALFQCSLNDYDVQALLRGLVAPEQPAAATSALTTLRLAGNPACTWRSAALAVELLTETGGNTSLRVVDLEGAPPDTAVRLEYACTPAGHFHSGATLVAAADARGTTQEVSAEDVRALTPGQASRFRARRLHLRDDLDGTQVILPALMQQLRSILAARQTADAAAEEETKQVRTAATGTAAHLEKANAAVAAVVAALEATRSDVQDGRGDERAHADEADAASVRSAKEAEEEGAAAPTAADAAAPSPSADAAPRTAHSAGSASLLTNPPLFLTGRHVRSSPQARRAARLETSQRLAQVMADAVAFRRHVHPMQVDTHAPTCRDVHTRSTSSQYGSDSSASTWYAKEGFVLRPNGMTRVLVAPVLAGSAAPRQNVALEDVEDRPLQACWCTPRNTTNAAIYAGALHYHCVREGDPVRHGGGVTARVTRTQRKKTEGAAGAAAAGRAVLPPLGGGAAAAGHAAATAAVDHARSGNGRAYLACCGTGHTCLSSSVVASGSLRAQRMRTTLLTQSVPRTPSTDLRLGTPHRAEASSVGRVGASGPAGVPMHARGSFAPPSTPAVTMFGGATTVLTTGGGVSVALNYSPVAFFGSPHVPCAAGMEVKECS